MRHPHTVAQLYGVPRGTVLRGCTQPFNAYGYKYFSLLLLYPFVEPADLSQQAKSAAADGLTYSDSIDKKVRKKI
jgi:hypothetical protein